MAELTTSKGMLKPQTCVLNDSRVVGCHILTFESRSAVEWFLRLCAYM